MRTIADAATRARTTPYVLQDCLQESRMAQPPMIKTRALVSATCGAIICLLVNLLAQPIPVSYSVRLASATVYDTRSRDEDTIHAALTVFVNGERKGSSIWDGKGWDGSRTEGRAWVTGLHLLGTPTASSVQVSTGRLQDTDTVQIVFELLNSAGAPSS